MEAIVIRAIPSAFNPSLQTEESDMPKTILGPDVDLDREIVILPSGHRYTEADADADVEWILQRSRPPLNNGASSQLPDTVEP